MNQPLRRHSLKNKALGSAATLPTAASLAKAPNTTNKKSSSQQQLFGHTNKSYNQGRKDSMITSKLDKTSVASGGTLGASATELYERVLSAGPDSSAKLAWHSSIAKEGALNTSQAMLDLKEMA